MDLKEHDERRAGATPPERPAGEMPGWINAGNKVAREQGRGGGAGIEFGGAIVVFTLLGYWADRKLDTLPLFLLVGLVLGFGGGLLHLVRSFKSKSSSNADKSKKPG